MPGLLAQSLSLNATLVIASLIMALIASGFFFIGNKDFHQKGLFLVTLSILFSFCALTFLPFGFVGVVGVNLLFYVVLLIIKRVRAPR